MPRTERTAPKEHRHRWVCVECFERARHKSRGEGSVHAKLTGTMVSEIRARVALGESQASLAREFGVSGPNVHYIVTRRSWRDTA